MKRKRCFIMEFFIINDNFIGKQSNACSLNGTVYIWFRPLVQVTFGFDKDLQFLKHISLIFHQFNTHVRHISYLISNQSEHIWLYQQPWLASYWIFYNFNKIITEIKERYLRKYFFRMKMDTLKIINLIIIIKFISILQCIATDERIYKHKESKQN